MKKLVGGPLDGHAVNPKQATYPMIHVHERPELNVSLDVGKMIPNKPTSMMAVIGARIGTYELRADGDYYWCGWNGA